MPIIRYFVFVGGLLLALLVAADRYLPAPVELAGASDPDKTVIRITSARALPEKIVFDTRPLPDVPKVAEADRMTEEPRQPMQEARAEMPAAPSRQTEKTPPPRVSAEPRPHPKHSARPSKRAPERRLAFERHDAMPSGWW